jgi:acetoin utilization deacetylase AcuC-like enzyme
MYYTSHSIDSGYIRKTRQPNPVDSVEKERVLESTTPCNSIDIRNVNIPWAVSGVGDADYIYAFQKIVMPIAYEFNPQFVIGKSCVSLI